MPPDLTESAAIAELTRIGFPPFTLDVKRREELIQPRKRTRPDAELELEWQGKRRRFIVEYKASATPRQVDVALTQLRDYLREYGTTPDVDVQPATRDRFRMFLAPYLSPAILERLIREGVSGIDLSGNGVVIIPGEWFVMRTGNENRYPSSAPIKNIYRGRSSLVCRALLLRAEYPSVGAIVDALRDDKGGNTGVTQATVSKVLKTLQEELLITRAGEGRSSSIRLTQPGELLDRLVRNYQQPKTSRILRGVPVRTIPGDEDDVSETTPMAIMAAAAERAGVRYAIDQVASYASFPGSEEVRIYVQSLAPIIDADAIREDDRFATVRLVETRDPTAYFDTRVVGGTSRVSPIQVYLELANGTKREREISDTVRARILSEFGTA